MALTKEQRRWFRSGIANKRVADAIADQIDSGGNPVAASVAAFGSTTNLSLTAPAPVDLNATFSDTEVETALLAKADQSAVSSMMSTAETRLDNIEAKINAVIAALKAAGLMSSS